LRRSGQTDSEIVGAVHSRAWNQTSAAEQLITYHLATSGPESEMRGGANDYHDGAIYVSLCPTALGWVSYESQPSNAQR
jgi:hypothetical protein